MRIFKKIFNSKMAKKTDEIKFSKLIVEPENQISSKCSIQINWSQSTKDVLKLYDCDFDEVMDGLNLFAIELKNERMLDENSLLFYNSQMKTENGQITNTNKSIILESLIGNEKYDGFFSLDIDRMDQLADKIIFFIGRPRTNNEVCKSWIDSFRVRRVANEKVYLDIFIDEILIKNNYVYYYNKWGALSILELNYQSGEWKFILDNQPYKNGLYEIINKYK